MQFPVALLPLLAVASAAPAPAPAPAPDAIDNHVYPAVTVQPYLGPLCQLTNVALGLLCKFNKVTLEADDECVNIDDTCAVHHPTSFTARTSEIPDPAMSCRVSVWAKRNCSGDKAQTKLLKGEPYTCSNSLFPTKLIDGEQVSHPLAGPLLPFGFESLKLECE